MKSGKFIIMIIERFTPITRFLSRLYQLPERYTLHIPWYFDTAHIQKSRSKVYVLRQSCYLSFRLDMSGPAHNHRHTERFFVHETLIKPTMFSQVEALIGSIDYNRIFIQSGTFQIIKNLSHTFVYTRYNSHIILQVTLVFPLRDFFEWTFSGVEFIISITVCIKKAAAFIRFHCSQKSMRPRVEQ